MNRNYRAHELKRSQSRSCPSRDISISYDSTPKSTSQKIEQLQSEILETDNELKIVYSVLEIAPASKQDEFKHKIQALTQKKEICQLQLRQLGQQEQEKEEKEDKEDKEDKKYEEKKLYRK